MLHLRTDAELGRGEGITLQPIGGDTHAAEVVLLQRDGGASETEVPGFQTGLRKSDVAPHTLRCPLGQIERHHVQNVLGDLRIFGLDVGFHLLRSSHRRTHDLRAGHTAGGSGPTAHCGLDRLAEGVHGVGQAELRPEMLRVTVVGGDAPLAALLVADDDPIPQRVEGELPAEHGEQLHRRLIGALGNGLGGGKVRAGESGPTRIPDAARFAHLHPDVGVVAAGPAMPASVVPGEALVHGAIVAVNEAVDTGPVVAGLVPVADEHLGAGLGTAHGVEHEALDRDLPACGVAGIFGEDGLDQLHSPSPPFSARSWSCSSTSFSFWGTGRPRWAAFSSRDTPSLDR